MEAVGEKVKREEKRERESEIIINTYRSCVWNRGEGGEERNRENDEHV